MEISQPAQWTVTQSLLYSSNIELITFRLTSPVIFIFFNYAVGLNLKVRLNVSLFLYSYFAQLIHCYQLGFLLSNSKLINCCSAHIAHLTLLQSYLDAFETVFPCGNIASKNKNNWNTKMYYNKYYTKTFHCCQIIEYF